MEIINAQEFEETINSGTTLVDFFADWCGPCKMLGPVLEEADVLYSDIKFVKVNVDDNMELAEKYGVMSIPAVFLFRDGEVIAKTGGYQDINGVKHFIDDATAA